MFTIIKENHLTKQEVQGIPYYWGDDKPLEDGANCFTLSNYILFRQTGKIFLHPKEGYIDYACDTQLPPTYVKDVVYETLKEPDQPSLEKEGCLILIKIDTRYGISATFKENDTLYACLTGSFGKARSSIVPIRALRRYEPVFWSIENSPYAVQVEYYLGRNRDGKPRVST